MSYQGYDDATYYTYEDFHRSLYPDYIPGQLALGDEYEYQAQHYSGLDGARRDGELEGWMDEDEMHPSFGSNAECFD